MKIKMVMKSIIRMKYDADTINNENKTIIIANSNE